MLKGGLAGRQHNSSILLSVAGQRFRIWLASAWRPHHNLGESPHGLADRRPRALLPGQDLFCARRHLGKILEFLLEQSWRELLLPQPLTKSHETQHERKPPTPAHWDHHQPCFPARHSKAPTCPVKLSVWPPPRLPLYGPSSPSKPFLQHNGQACRSATVAQRSPTGGLAQAPHSRSQKNPQE